MLHALNLDNSVRIQSQVLVNIVHMISASTREEKTNDCCYTMTMIWGLLHLTTATPLHHVGGR